MTREELLKELGKLPKLETNNLVSTMNAINVDDLMNAVDRLNKIPDYNDLLKENQELEKRVEELNRFKFSYKKDETQTLSKIYSKKFVEDISKMKSQQKEFIKYLEDEIKLYENDILNFSKDYNVYFSLINDLRVSKAKIKDILKKYKEIIGVSNDY